MSGLTFCTHPISTAGKSDWSCEACFAIYPLYHAIMLYLIDMLLLDPNVLRDSILVCLDLSICRFYVFLFYCLLL